MLRFFRIVDGLIKEMDGRGGRERPGQVKAGGLD